MYIYIYINPPLYSDVHLRTPCHEPQTRDVWRLGLYVTVWTTAFLEDVLGNGSFSRFRRTLPHPPQKKFARPPGRAPGAGARFRAWPQVGS